MEKKLFLFIFWVLKLHCCYCLLIVYDSHKDYLFAYAVLIISTECPGKLA